MYTYQEESYADVIEEMKPLLESHYEEIAMYKEAIEFAPSYEAYELMDKAGAIHIYTAREDGVLVGYCVSFVQKHPHYKNDWYAVNDVLYVHPDHRHTEVAPEMISCLEKIMKAKGVSVMTFHMKTYKTFETLMDSLGFDQAEYIYTKLIKE